MPTYQFLLHSTGFTLDVGDGEPPAVGFYTSRRARASNSSEARKIVMAAMNDDPKLADIFASGHDAGLFPKTEVQEVYMIPWWRAILPWRKPGLAFYPEDSEGEDSQSPAGIDNANKP
jgi:hypothetical protein